MQQALKKCDELSTANPAQPELNHEEKRQYSRDPARDLSEIILDGKKFGFACMIHDISEKGARLEVSCGELPKRFVLANYTKKTKTLCRQVWRDKRMIGVMFLTNPRFFEINDRL